MNLDSLSSESYFYYESSTMIAKKKPKLRIVRTPVWKIDLHREVHDWLMEDRTTREIVRREIAEYGKLRASVHLYEGLGETKLPNEKKISMTAMREALKGNW